MKKTWLILAVALVTSTPALADVEKTFSWTPPTTYTDGSPLPASQLDHYILTCTPTGGEPNVPKGTQFKKTFPPGTFTCALAAVATNQNVSMPSNTVTFTVPQPTPNPPTGFSVD